MTGVLPVGEDKWRAVRDMFSSDPTIIGFCEPPVSSRRGAPPSFRLVGNAPALSKDIQVVLYQRHRRQTMRFYAFDFTELDILPLQDSAHDPSPSSVKNAEAVLQSDFTRTHAAASRRSASLDAEVLSQLLADLVERRSRMRDTQPPALSTPLTSTPERPSTPVIPPAAGTSERRSRYEPLRRAASELHVILRDLSTTADQLDVRFEQGIYVAGELPHVYHDKARTVTSISKYIKFHNCVWLVLNDVIIGVAFGSFLCENRRVLAAWLEYVMQHYLVHRMELALLWLNNWPAGLKLNTELSQFYCHSLIGVVSAWGWLLARAAPYFPTVIGAIGIAGCCGMTMIVSLLSDTLSLLTAHLYACYYISATVFRHQLSLAGSLWNLFRDRSWRRVEERAWLTPETSRRDMSGKRYNVLRNRIDSWDYELDQLLLGTILFTLLAFLYPTVLTYYALFATARLAIMMVHAVLDTVTALLNHFPLFALLLRVKDPLRLPGGICIQRTKAGPLLLTSQPAPLSSIFRHYAKSGAKQRAARRDLELGLGLLRRRAQRLALVPEHPAQDLPARALGDGLDEDDAARQPLHFVTRTRTHLLEPRLDLLRALSALRGLRSDGGLEDDVREGRLAREVVGDADHGDVRDVRVVEEVALELGGRDLVALDLDELLDTVRDEHVAVRVEEHLVARAEPPGGRGGERKVSETRCEGTRGRKGLSERDLRALEEELTGFVDTRERAVRLDDLRDDARDKLACAPERAHFLRHGELPANDSDPCPMETFGKASTSWVVSSADTGAAAATITRRLESLNFFVNGCCERGRHQGICLATCSSERGTLTRSTA
ncbi:hypothetical protein ACG7TL_001986 [Trametes sanguinea]